MLLAIVCGWVAAATSPAWAQFGVGGVLIDAEGAITVERVPASRRPQRRRPLPLATESRAVSLRELLEEIVARGAAGPTDEQRHLAGLLRVDAVVIAPDDVLIAGPAIAYRVGPAGTIEPTEPAAAEWPKLWLEDLLLALEHVAGGGGEVGCSIDMTPEGLQRLQRYVQANSQPVRAAAAAARYPKMAEALGTQTVRLFGLPETSHAAAVAVRADVRLKRIALGLEPSGVSRVKSQLAMLRPGGNAVQRWWFAPKYDPITVAVDDAASVYRITGPRLQVLAQDEVVAADGSRSDAGATRGSTEAFAKQFSRYVDDVAEQRPSIRELQGLTDLYLVAALLLRHERDRPEGAAPLAWDVLGAVQAAAVTPSSLPAPRTIESLANAKRAGSLVIGLVGGVKIAPAAMVADAGLETAAEPAAVPSVPEGWFADADD